MRVVIAACLPAFLLAAPALAGEPDKPVTERDVSAADVATTPVTDLNLKKEDVPPLLIAAQERPYSLAGLARCPQIAAAVGELDEVLGDDIDLPQEDSRRMSAGRVAQSVVGAFIPFRGVIRELSGANKQERLLQAAIQAGIARRSFLKGYGTARGCRYPARAATLDVYNQRMADLRGEPAPSSRAPEQPAVERVSQRSPRYVSQPVVQRTSDRRQR